MRAGRLDRRVTIQERSLARNSYGEQIETWSDVAEVWGEKTDLRGTESLRARQIQGEVETRFLIRYRTGVGVTNRLICEGVTYDIRQVSEVGRRAWLEITATARK